MAFFNAAGAGDFENLPPIDVFKWYPRRGDRLPIRRGVRYINFGNKESFPQETVL
jgi:hypothetical protein